jgi:hypothetical protein
VRSPLTERGKVRPDLLDVIRHTRSLGVSTFRPGCVDLSSGMKFP